MGLNPFRSGQCLSTLLSTTINSTESASQSLSIRAMSFDFCSEKKTEIMNKSQSLSSRAMSFDAIPPLVYYRRFMSQSLSSRAMSFDRTTSGRTTESNVSIPFEQGDVFRRFRFLCIRMAKGSQSLSIRAMSFDVT